MNQSPPDESALPIGMGLTATYYDSRQQGWQQDFPACKAKLPEAEKGFATPVQTGGIQQSRA